MSEFKLPDVGEGLTEAEIVEWKVKVGDVIKVNDIIVDIETAKSVVELPSPYEGRIGALLVEEGQTVPVGTPIIRIGEPAEGETKGSAEGETGDSTGDEAPNVEPGTHEGRQAVLVGYGPRTGAVKRKVRKPAGGPVTAAPTRVASVDTEKVAQHAVLKAPKPVASEPVTAQTDGHAANRALAKPPVRKLAKDLGVDLGAIDCAGAVITRADVEAFANGAGAALVEAEPAGQQSAQSAARGAAGMEDRRVPIKGVRKMTAEAMVSSAFTAPHVTEWVTLDVTPTMELVKRLKADKVFADVKVSPLLVVAKAVCLAMRRTPELNSTWDAAAQEIVFMGSVSLGIAAATPRGLVVPNIVGAESMSMHDLAVALGELIEVARAGKTQPAQMSGGSFTITNIGVFGIDAGTPILNPGEAGILAVGAINKRPWVDESGQIVARDVTTLALSFDHRVVDGEQGSRFLADVASILREPGLALTF